MTTFNLVEFLGRDVNQCIRKISKSASMVGVAVSKHDMPYVFRRKPGCFDPTYRGVRFVELESSHVDERLSHSFDRIANVAKANSRVNKGKLIAILQQQTVANDRGVRWDYERSAIDMVNCRHRLPLHDLKSDL